MPVTPALATVRRGAVAPPRVTVNGPATRRLASSGAASPTPSTRAALAVTGTTSGDRPTTWPVARKPVKPVDPHANAGLVRT